MAKNRRRKISSAQAGNSTNATAANKWGELSAKVTAFLVALQVVWVFLEPNDAVSVFRGAALPQNFLWLITCVIAAISGLLGGLKLKLPKWQIGLVVFVIGWIAISAVLAGSENNPRTAWHGFWQVVSAIGAFLILRSVAIELKHRVVLVGILLAGCIALSLNGLYEVCVSMPAARAEYLKDPNAYLEKNQAIVAPEGSPERKRFEDRFLGSKEPLSTFALTNSLAVLLTSGIIILIGCLLTPSGAADQKKTRSIDRRLSSAAAAVGLGIMVVVWVLTRSRTAYIALAVSMCYLWFVERFTQGRWSLSSGGRYVLIGIAVAFGGCAIWVVGNDRLVLSESLYSLRFRLDYWYGSVGVLRDNFLFGVGLGNFQSYYPAYMLETASETIADPHNWFFDTATSFGFPVALILAIGLASTFVPQAKLQSVFERASICRLDLSRSLAIGAVFGGGVVAVGVGLFSAVDIAPQIAGWVFGAGLVCLALPKLHAVVEQRPSVIVAAAFSFVVTLMASGSWQASGLLVSFVVLLAIGGATSEASNQADDGQGQDREFSSDLRHWWPSVMAAMGVTAFIFQSWLPVTNGWLLTQRIEYEKSVSQQLALVEELIETDPLDSTGAAIRAQLLCGNAAGDRDSYFAKNEEAYRETTGWLDQDSSPFANWELAAELMLDLAAAAQRFSPDDTSPWLDRSSTFFKQAVRRYPSSVEIKVQTALALFLAGDEAEARQYLDEAERLSLQTPHDDKKINMQQVFLPARLVRSHKQELQIVGGRLNAELAAQWLRNQLN